MHEYEIKYARHDMNGYVSTSVKWAKSEKDAVQYLLSESWKKTNKVVRFKKGGSGEIISVAKIT